jgi:hypothetical protein
VATGRIGARPARGDALSQSFDQTTVAGNVTVPGPGRPTTVSITLIPVAGMQNVDARTGSAIFGQVGSGNAGSGAAETPSRSSVPPPRSDRVPAVQRCRCPEAP